VLWDKIRIQIFILIFRRLFPHTLKVLENEIVAINMIVGLIIENSGIWLYFSDTIEGS